MNTDDAWLAGLFEGEGCISWNGPNGVRLAIKMTDRDVIERAVAVAGVGSFREHPPRPRPGLKLIFEWYVTNARDVLLILDRIQPWLGARRTSKAIDARQRIAGMARMSPTCRQGHPLVGENLYIHPVTRSRQCRACRRRRDSKRDYRAEPARRASPPGCPHGDEFCPCQDELGDACHYEGRRPSRCPTSGLQPCTVHHPTGVAA